MSDVEEYLTAYLPSLLDVLSGTDVRELEMQDGDARVRLHREFEMVPFDDSSTEEQPALAEQISPSTHLITSPLVGTFYRASKPGMDPFVSEGSVVEEDTAVGIVEALHVLTEVEAGCRGIVTGVHAVDGQPVEYGQILFVVMPRD